MISWRSACGVFFLYIFFVHVASPAKYSTEEEHEKAAEASVKRVAYLPLHEQTISTPLPSNEDYSNNLLHLSSSLQSPSENSASTPIKFEGAAIPSSGDVDIKDRNIRHIDHKLQSRSNYLKHSMQNGVVGLIPNYSVHGAIIMSDRGEKPVETDPEKLKLISARIHNVQRLRSQLPFPLTEWAAVFTLPCPTQPADTHKSERGLSWAHYRIWKEFAFFDPDLIDSHEQRLKRRGPSSTASDTRREDSASRPADVLSSSDGVYQIHPNGTMIKNGLEFKDGDILVIFEDDADSCIRGLNTTLAEELSAMTTDLLYLGWCEGRLARPVPLCAHAYAVTRTGARKLADNWEPCGLALDEQFVIFAKNNLLSWRTAFPFSYNSNLNKRYKVHNPGDKTFGIFHQNKWDLGSFMGHY